MLATRPQFKIRANDVGGFDWYIGNTLKAYGGRISSRVFEGLLVIVTMNHGAQVVGKGSNEVGQLLHDGQ